jgi:hypothetical protein
MNELTWEYLFEALGNGAKQVNKIDLDRFPQRTTERNAVLGLYDVLPRLHSHPQLHKFIPYLGITIFHWWPSEDCRITLDTWESRNQFRIRLTARDVEEEVTVSIDGVIDTLLAFMQQAQHLDQI